MFYIGEPNTGNTFLVNFLEHNQTNENVFLSVKYFPLKFILHVAKHSLSLQPNSEKKLFSFSFKAKGYSSPPPKKKKPLTL